jgi:hypothetical protein
VRRGAALAAVVALILCLLPAGARAATPTFGTPTATADFGTDINFRQPYDSPVPLARAELLVDFPQAIGPFVTQVDGATDAGGGTLGYLWSFSGGGHMVPNTRLTARWRLVPKDRSLPPVIGPEVSVLYADTRFAWKTLTGDLVRLHWYQGPDSFGRAALAIGEKAVRDAAAFMGVTETQPIDFFVYADQQVFYDALGPGTRENVGGEAFSDIRTMFALIGPDNVTDPWVGIVIPHELTHLVFDTAVHNPYHFPPRWLNEGVAVYLSQGYGPSDRAAVTSATAANRLMPLTALGGQFPTSADRFSLAYAESVSAVDFLIRTKGTQALVNLLHAYAGGVTDDQAFTTATGMDVAGFEHAWLTELGASAPVEHGPQAAAPGPVPPGWGSAAVGAAPSAASPSSAQPAPSSTSAPVDSGQSPIGAVPVIVIAAIAGLLIGGSIAYRRRRRAGEAVAAGAAPDPLLAADPPASPGGDEA